MESGGGTSESIQEDIDTSLPVGAAFESAVSLKALADHLPALPIHLPVPDAACHWTTAAAGAVVESEAELDAAGVW